MAIKKSEDAKFQLHIWSKLLEGRIALQKVVLAARDIDHGVNNEQPEDEKEKLKSPVDESTIKSVSKLLTSLVTLRDTYRQKSQFCLPGDEANEIDVEEYSNINDELLGEKHDNFRSIRDSTIEKWCEKTKIGTIPKKGYVALELPTLQLIKNSLRDKDRLIRRTQLDRTSHLDDSYHPETFNDDDFYHILLKEVISKDENRRWVEVQRLKYKNKRKANTKATKGRQIKKDLIPKLVNFMAPTRPANMRHLEKVPQQIRTELIKSLFGGRVTQSKGTIDMDSD